MKPDFPNRACGALLLALIGLCWSWNSPAQVSLSGRLKNFKFPDYYEAAPGQTNQVLKTLLSGAEARQLSDRQVLIDGLRIESFQKDGDRELEVQAAGCVFDITTREATGSGRLRVSSPGGLYTLEGEGFLWRQSDGLLIISNRVVTTLNRDLLAARSAEADPAPPASTGDIVRITSDRCVFNNESNLFTQSGHVLAEDSEMELACGLLTVQLTPARSLREIRAVDGVVLINKTDQSRATGETAVYSIGPESENVVLSGQPVWRDAAGRQEVKAGRFKYDLDDKTVRAAGGAVMRLPRGSFSQPSLLPSGAAPASPPPSDSNGTNQIQITSEVLTIELASANRPHRRAIAQTHVVILSPADDTRAVGDKAVYDEATGRIELSGQARWEAEGRIVQADTLAMDRTNRTFQGRGHAYFKLPLSQVGQSDLFPAQTNRALSTNLFLEVASDTLDYQTNVLVFDGQVRARLLEGIEVLSQVRCGRLTAQFTDRLDSLLAEKRVLAEQFPRSAATPRAVTNMLSCDVLSAKFSQSGRVIALVAANDVQAAQVEVRTNRSQVTITELTCEVLTAVILPKAGGVDKLHAERHVVVSQGDKLARGDEAVYTAADNRIVLRGHPYAEFADGKVRDAEALIWERATGTFRGRGRYRIELTKPLGSTNQGGFFLPTQ